MTVYVEVLLVVICSPATGLTTTSRVVSVPGVGLVVSGIFTVPASPALRAWSWPVSWVPPRVAVTLMPVSSLSPELVIWMSTSCASDGTLLLESGVSVVPPIEVESSCRP